MIPESAPCHTESLVRETVENYFAAPNKNNNRLALRNPVDLPEVNAESEVGKGTAFMLVLPINKYILHYIIHKQKKQQLYQKFVIKSMFPKLIVIA